MIIINHFIFTAFNFIESLLVELTQQCLAADGVDSTVQQEIEQALQNATPSISWTYKLWLKMLGKPEVHGCSEFREFCNLRKLRNNLIHPMLEPLRADQLTQDQLLEEVNAAKAAWAVDEVKKMGRRLYTNFGVRIPPEVQ